MSFIRTAILILLAFFLKRFGNIRTLTADLVSAVRAHHLLYDPSPIFSDSYAFLLTSITWQVVLRKPFLKSLVISKLFAPFFPLEPQIVARAQYNEECLDESLKAGLEQYVTLGAGMDTLALRRRDMESKLSIFEVDHPATQALKWKRIQQLEQPVPSNLIFVPLDFTSNRLKDALNYANFDSSKRTLFSWFGVTYYLDPELVAETIQTVGEISAPGSELVFDYRMLRSEVVPDARRSYDWLAWWTEQLGERMRSAFDEDSISSVLSASGFSEISILSPEGQRNRYLQNRIKTSIELRFIFSFVHAIKQARVDIDVDLKG